MIVVWPDTNALHHDPFLRRHDAQRLLETLDSSDSEMVLSPVVDLELQRQHQERVESAAKEMNNTARRLARFSSSPSDTVEAAQTAFVSDIRIAQQAAQQEAYKRSSTRIASWPATPVRELVERELERRRPFLQKEPGSIGFRDAVIWIGLVELLAEDADLLAVFVTADNGFLTKDGSLHPDLLEDLESYDVDISRIRVARGLPQAVIEIGLLRKQISERDAALLRAVSDFVGDLNDLVWGYEWDYHHGGRIAPDFDLELPPDLEEIQLVAVDVLSDPEIVPDGASSVQQELDLSFSGQMRRDVWLADESTNLDLWDSSVADPYVWVETSRRVLLTCELEVDADEQTANVVEFTVDLLPDTLAAIGSGR